MSTIITNASIDVASSSRIGLNRRQAALALAILALALALFRPLLPEWLLRVPA